MGMYDTVWVTCKCGHEIGLQTKAGPCSLNDYDVSDAPPPVLADVGNELFWCPQCGRRNYVEVRTIAIPVCTEEINPSAIRTIKDYERRSR